MCSLAFHTSVNDWGIVGVQIVHSYMVSTKKSAQRSTSRCIQSHGHYRAPIDFDGPICQNLPQTPSVHEFCHNAHVPILNASPHEQHDVRVPQMPVVSINLRYLH